MALGDWIQIGGQTWNVRVLTVTQDANVLYTENTGRTVAKDAPITLDALGTFINYKLDIAPLKGYEKDYDALYDFVIIPRNYGIKVKMPYNQSTIEYDAYISSASRKIKIINEKNPTTDIFGNEIKVKWEKMSITCIPIKAQISTETGA